MPHAPLLLPEVAGAQNASCTAGVSAATRALDLSGAETIVIASPHGAATGVYARAEGDLDGFGPRGLGVSAATDEALVNGLGKAWGRPLLDAPADHGVVVPLRLLQTAIPVVAVAFEEAGGTAEAARLARALTSIAGGRRIAFLASVNLSAGLGASAPLPSLEDAAAVDGRVLRALQLDPAALVEQAGALDRAGSCAAAPLAAFGMLFSERACDVLAYEHPFGVGYAVASVR